MQSNVCELISFESEKMKKKSLSIHGFGSLCKHKAGMEGNIPPCSRAKRYNEDSIAKYSFIKCMISL